MHCIHSVSSYALGNLEATIMFFPFHALYTFNGLTGTTEDLPKFLLTFFMCLGTEEGKLLWRFDVYAM